MKLSEFVLTRIEGKSPRDIEYFADVSVTTGMLWWKKTERRKIHREYGGFWYFVDTGEFLPQRRWSASTKQARALHQPE